MAKKRLLLIGGGHAHLQTLAHLSAFTDKEYQVTVVQPSDYHYYSGMGPGMLGWTYQPAEIRFATRKVVEQQGGTFIRDRVALIDPERQVVHMEDSEQEIGYDVLSCNVGSYVPMDRVVEEGSEIFTVKPIERLFEARKRILYVSSKRHVDVAVVGGGPSAVEIAGNIQQLGELRTAYKPTVHIFAGKEFMAGRPPRVSSLARNLLSARGVRIVEGSYVSGIRPGQVTLDNGVKYKGDIIFLALGIKPSQIFSRSGLPTGPDGGLLVNRFLQSTGYPNIFGGGDCIHFEPKPLDKVGVYAVRENPILYHNLMASLEGNALKAFKPGDGYLLIYNLGNNTGIFHKGPIIFSGRLAFLIKDYIDRKFIDKFQAIEQDGDAY